MSERRGHRGGRGRAPEPSPRQVARRLAASIVANVSARGAGPAGARPAAPFWVPRARGWPWLPPHRAAGVRRGIPAGRVIPGRGSRGPLQLFRGQPVRGLAGRAARRRVTPAMRRELEDVLAQVQRPPRPRSAPAVPGSSRPRAIDVGRRRPSRPGPTIVLDPDSDPESPAARLGVSAGAVLERPADPVVPEMIVTLPESPIVSPAPLVAPVVIEPRSDLDTEPEAEPAVEPSSVPRDQAAPQPLTPPLATSSPRPPAVSPPAPSSPLTQQEQEEDQPLFGPESPPAETAPVRDPWDSSREEELPAPAAAPAQTAPLPGPSSRGSTPPIDEVAPRIPREAWPTWWPADVDAEAEEGLPRTALFRPNPLETAPPEDLVRGTLREFDEVLRQRPATNVAELTEARLQGYLGWEAGLHARFPVWTRGLLAFPDDPEALEPHHRDYPHLLARQGRGRQSPTFAAVRPRLRRQVAMKSTRPRRPVVPSDDEDNDPRAAATPPASPRGGAPPPPPAPRAPPARRGGRGRPRHPRQPPLRPAVGEGRTGPRATVSRGVTLTAQQRQVSAELYLRRAPLMRVVRELVRREEEDRRRDDPNFPTLRIQASALSAIQEAAEHYLTGVFEDASLCATHAKRQTVMPQDLRLVRFLRNDPAFAPVQLGDRLRQPPTRREEQQIVAAAETARQRAADMEATTEEEDEE